MARKKRTKPENVSVVGNGKAEIVPTHDLKVAMLLTHKVDKLILTVDQARAWADGIVEVVEWIEEQKGARPTP